jgi:hypothetical protein
LNRFGFLTCVKLRKRGCPALVTNVTNAFHSHPAITDMVRAVKPEILDAIVQSIPIRRLGEASKLRRLSPGDEAAFATGADVSLNGGLYMR